MLVYHLSVAPKWSLRSHASSQAGQVFAVCHDHFLVHAARTELNQYLIKLSLLGALKVIKPYLAS